MKEQECGYYLLSSTAMDVWKRGDVDGIGRMMVCVAAVHKESFFRRVIYRSSLVAPEALRELAETIFWETWERFNERGREGMLRLDGREYAGYLFTAFKGNYLKGLEREVRRAVAEGESRNFGVGEEGEGEGEWAERARKALERMSPDCRRLLVWKHIAGLTHDEIARRKNINRSSSIKMLSRCGKRFSEIWRDLGQQTKK